MTTQRLAIMVILALGLLAAPLAVEAQPAGKVYRIGFLGTFPPKNPQDRPWAPFVQSLREHGYVEGQNDPSSNPPDTTWRST